ncbi:MAG TPA: MFS transporter [Thermoleophilaceae bacterium]|nr:MFS transporter [Thermoleophilaceae bacterium]
MKLGRYLAVLRTPGVARVALFATTGRLPFAIVPLSIVLLMREEGYHYGQIGAVVGAEALAVGVTAGFVGRLVDRVGRPQVILVTGGVTSLVLCGEAIGILSNAAVWLLVLLAALQGGTIPPISASMRSLWSRLVPEETLESAFAFDAISLELVFVIGPLIAAGLATALSPAVGLFLCAAFYALAATGFATAPAARSAAAKEDHARTRAGALRSGGMRTLVFAGAVTAVSFGALEVALPAFAEAEGSRGAVGPLITVWALGSAIGGLWYGARSWDSSIEKRFVILMALLALGSAPLPFAPSIGVMGMLLVLTGFALAPLATTEYALVDRLAPPGTQTEAYSWQIVANVMGAAAGSLIAGLLAEEVSVEWALATAGIACAAGFVVAVAGRRSLRPAASAAP